MASFATDSILLILLLIQAARDEILIECRILFPLQVRNRKLWCIPPKEPGMFSAYFITSILLISLYSGLTSLTKYIPSSESDSLISSLWLPGERPSIVLE
jgi:hypothetical protein